MKQSLRKTPSQLHLAYRYGAGSDRLIGRQFGLVQDGDLLTLSIDLTANLQSRDKAAASYLDALNLLHNHHRLLSLQSGDNLLRSRLIRIWEQVELPRLRMCLDLGARGRFLYSVRPHSLLEGGLQLDVEEELQEDIRVSRPLAAAQPDFTGSRL
jgi:hypothetical protein